MVVVGRHGEDDSHQQHALAAAAAEADFDEVAVGEQSGAGGAGVCPRPATRSVRPSGSEVRRGSLLFLEDGDFLGRGRLLRACTDAA